MTAVLADRGRERRRIGWSGLGSAVLAALVALTELHAATPDLSGGSLHTIALKQDGTVWAWGDDSLGQLGNGRTLVRPSPVRVDGLSGVVSTAAGWSSGTGAPSRHVLALKSDGRVWSWGANDRGQLGDGSIDARTTAAPVPGLNGVIAVAAGGGFSLALKQDGTVWSWGDNLASQLGDGTRTARSNPGLVPGLSGVTAIAAGWNHALALRSDGSLWGWGGNSLGQLGIGASPGVQPTPAQVPGLGGLIAVAAGFDHSVVLDSAGTVRAWGANFYGEAGDGSTARRVTPAIVGGLADVVGISAGSGFSLALKRDGTVWGWGNNYYGQLGDGRQGSTQLFPVQALGLVGIRSISAGSDHSVAIGSDGRFWAWGVNKYGQFCSGATSPRPSNPPSAGTAAPPPSVISGVTGIVFASAGWDFSVLVGGGNAGNVWTCGSNSSGQLGDGAVAYQVTPGQVQGLSNVVQARASGAQGIALKEDGAVWTWGGGVDPLGDNLSTPTMVAGLTGVARVATGTTSYAIRADGSVWTIRNSQATGPEPGLSGVRDIAVGLDHVLYLKGDGTVLARGRNLYGELGNGTTTSSSAPVQVDGLSSVVAVGAGTWFSVALKSDGSVWAWGLNSEGTLGDGSTTNRTVPVRVNGISDAVEIAAGNFHALALLRDGSIRGWGRNSSGQLGDGTLVNRTVPVRVLGIPAVVAIDAGVAHSLAIRVDGTAWSWGYNVRGQLGDGTLAYRGTPALVRRQGGAGGFATNDWYIDLGTGAAKDIPSASIPPILVVAATGASGAVTANAQFRAQDAGRAIRIFAYAPASVVQSARDGVAKDDGSCVLSQLTSTGLQSTGASTLQAVGSVTAGLNQSVTVLNNLLSLPVAGATFCIGTGTGTEAVQTANSQCVVTVPAASVCLPPSSVVGANVPGALSGLWWNAAESGWGIHFTQRASNVFAAWYTYDTSGNPKWYVASSCTGATGTSGTCSGTLYEVSGPTFFGTTFNPNAVNVLTAGSLQVNFQSVDSASMSYAVGGQSRTVSIVRQPLGTGAIPGVDYTDLWWNPIESGWGMAIAQQASNMFLAWYVYDNTGKPVWYVASNCAVSGTGCTGTLYRTTGPAFGPTFNPGAVRVFTAGTVSITFSDPNNGTLSYTVGGVTASKAITRQLF